MNKKYLLLFLLLLLPLSVFAEEGENVKTLEATKNNNTITFNGTTQDDVVAVMCKLYNDEDEEIEMLSVEVQNNKTFTGSFVTTETGDFTVACANYEGGNFVTADITVETLATLTVTFNTNGGSTINPVQVTYNDTVDEPEDPTKNDKVFGGWYEDDTLTTPFDFNTHIIKNTTLYAKWNDPGEEPGDENIQVQVIFFGEGGTYQVDFAADDSINPEPLGEPVNSSHRYFAGVGQEVTLTAIPSEGYNFVGWFETSEQETETPGIMEWVPGNILSGLTEYTFNANGPYHNIMPIFEQAVSCSNGVGHNNIWTITGGKVAVLYEEGGFDGTDFNGGTVVDYCNGDEITVKAQAEQGYHFVGWYVSNVQQGPQYYYTDKLVSQSTNYTYEPGTTMVQGIDEPINYLTAVFAEDEPGIYTVTFNTYGGTEISSVEVEEGNTVSRPASDPTKDGKVFGGWYSDETCSSEFNFNTPITANTTIYAKWKNKVTFNTMGGSAIDPVELEEDERLAEPAEPTKNGYVFDGWYEEEELEHEVDFNNPIEHNITIYAKWGIIYELSDDDDNEIAFVDEENQNLKLVVTDLETLSDDELLALNPILDRETFNALVESLTEAAKKYGTLISFLDISVVDANNNFDPIEVGEALVKLKLTDEIKGFKSYKLVYIDQDNNGNIVLNDAYDLTLTNGKLEGELEHLSAYALIGSNDESTTDTSNNKGTASSPKTFDNIMTWFIVLAISVIGLVFGIIKAKKRII